MRLIDADVLLNNTDGLEHVKYSQEYGHVVLVCDIVYAPTVDATEVVRCKDCIHGIPTRIDTVTGELSDERYCNRHRMCHLEDYYCADGERKETEDDSFTKRR